MKRKLIEVALPLEAINAAAAREKSIRHGHPSTLHLWWARRPLAACRAVLFAQLVDDPSSHPEEFPTGEDQEAERKRLFGIIERLVKWENTTNKEVLAEARAEIRRSCGGEPPPVLDPFCGGGSIPLEAQRLGLEAHASDLNPVPVLITKALIEIPPRFAGRPPVHPDPDGDPRLQTWAGAQGLAEDVRRYGNWMRERAVERIGHLYPKVTLPEGGEATVIAWLWARTVRCPNPACGATMPLVRSFELSKKTGRRARVEPAYDQAARRVRFDVRTGAGQAPVGTVDRRGARCLGCGQSASLAHVRGEARAGRMGAQLMAVVAEGDGGRRYLPPDTEHERLALEVAPPADAPDAALPEAALGFRVQGYGMTRWSDLFTARQLRALCTFGDLVGEARDQVLKDAVAAGLPDDGVPLAAGGAGAAAYADAVATYLGLGVSRLSDIDNALCRWEVSRTQVRNLFTRQAIPMLWDYAENNVFAGAAGDFAVSLERIVWVLADMPGGAGGATQVDASAVGVRDVVVSTDPPYYDNVPYADLSDFFFVWLRRSLGEVFPELFSTLLTPKTHELVADPFRHGGRSGAEEFFEHGLQQVFARFREIEHPGYPMTVYYAFKQSESGGEAGTASTGWETMLEGLIQEGFQVTATWPMRTELGNRMRGQASNALASSIVLACRPRAADAPVTTRRDFLAELRRELPEALRVLRHGNIAPVDLAQAAIGPGMAVYSRYAKVLEPDGARLGVRAALGQVNHVLDEVLEEQEGEFDTDTRWALAWFDQHGHDEGRFGDADTLSRAKDTSVDGMIEAGIVWSRGGKVRLLRREELEDGWDPGTDGRLTVWEVTQQLIRALESGGEQAAAELLRRVGGLGEVARDLAYRLYVTCERKKWSEVAQSYNGLAVAWPEIQRLASEGASRPIQQGML